MWLRKKNIEAAVIAGIISRESRAGNALVDGWGDNGNAFGLMQIDIRWHTIRGTWNSVEHITQGVEILIEMFNFISRKFPSWSTDQKLKGALAAYNAGPGSVNSFDQIDSGTTGGDYSNDCTARAKYYKRKGY
ncbi:lysozyme g-like [Rhinophrynus dorsalis]